VLLFTVAEQAVAIRNGLTVLAGICGALGVIWVFFRKPLKWLWRRILSGPFWAAYDVRQEAGIHRVVLPMVDELKAASKAQHDEQNATLANHGEGIATVSGQVAELSTSLGVIEIRLNTGSDKFADHEARIEAVEQRTIQPHLPDPTPKDEPT
jgi:hypothetical protein